MTHLFKRPHVSHDNARSYIRGLGALDLRI